MGDMRYTKQVVRYALAESIDDVPDQVDTELRRRVVDTLGAISAGYQVEGIETTTAYATETFNSGNCTLLDGSGRQVNPEGAVLANALAGNALDIDDGNRLTEGHPAAVVIPAALAISEKQDVTVKTFLNAVLAAYEVAVRTALTLKPWTGMYNGSGSWGAVGAATAAARIKDLDVDQACDALGIAEFNTPIAPVMRSVATPGSSVTKDGIGWGSYVGVTAAQMANRGLAGSGTVFDEEDANNEELETLGNEYFITDSYYKPYPGCRWTHSGIDAALELLDKHEIDPKDIEKVRAFSHRKAIELTTTRPKNPDHAEYSYPFLLAAAIVKEDWLEPTDLNEGMRTNERVREMIEKIGLEEDTDAQEKYPAQSTSRVAITTGSETYESDLISALGSRERPMTDADHRKKQKVLMDNYYGDGTADHLRTVIENDDALIGELISPFTG